VPVSQLYLVTVVFVVKVVVLSCARYSHHLFFLDGDNIRHGFVFGLGFINWR